MSRRVRNPRSTFRGLADYRIQSFLFRTHPDWQKMAPNSNLAACERCARRRKKVRIHPLSCGADSSSSATEFGPNAGHA